jgi:hypothetical protein
MGTSFKIVKFIALRTMNLAGERLKVQLAEISAAHLTIGRKITA